MNLLKRIFTSAECEAGGQASTPDASLRKGSKSSLGTYVGDSKTCPEGGRLHAKIEGRYVTVLRFNDKLSCIDSVCFHAGGPLGIGDIEDVNGHKCLVCPWHFYKIDVQTGDKYYQGLEFKDGKMLAGEWKSNGIRQRVHPVVEVDGKIFVTLSTHKGDVGVAGALGCGSADAPCPSSGPVDSDNYAFDSLCGDRVLNSPAIRAGGQSVGADGRKPSGQVLRGQYKP